MIKTILFRCLACSHRFTDEEREWCEAPATTQALAIQRLRALRDASSSGEYLNANDKKIADALDELMAPVAPPEESRAKARSLLVFQLRVEYADLRVALRDKGLDVQESMAEHVERRLKELNAPSLTPDEVQTVDDPQPHLSKAKANVVSQASNDEHSTIDESSNKQNNTQSVEDEEERERMSVAEQAFRTEWARQKLAGRAPTRTVEEYVQRRRNGEVFS